MTRKHDPNCRLVSIRMSMIGFLARQRPGHQQHETQRRDDREGPDEVGFEPVVALAFVEDDFEGAESRRDEEKADEVEAVAASHEFGPLPALLVGLPDQDLDERDRRDADRRVDQEAPMPGIVVGQPAAERRADDGRDHHRHAVEREGLAALLRRETNPPGSIATREPCPRRPGPAERGKNSSDCRSQAKPHRTEATVNSAMQAMKNCLRPNLVAIQPEALSTMALATR